MQKMETKIVGIVLSGGKSRRMGQEKGLVTYKGKALIEYAIDTLKPLCDELVISTTNDAYAYLGLPMIADEIPNCGPIGGISTCMKVVNADIYLVVSCDVPHVPTELYADLLKEMKAKAVIPIGDDERKQPLVACYSSDAFSFFQDAMESVDLKMMDLLSKIEPLYFKPSINSAYYQSNIFSNLNSKDDLLD